MSILPSLVQTARTLEEAGCRLATPRKGSAWTTIRMGGVVGLVALAQDTDALKAAWRYLCRSGRPFAVLGGGSNVILPDQAPDLTLLINQSRGIHAGDAGELICQSGTPISTLLRHCILEGRPALGFMAGIPGTLGGALAVNAGAWGKSIGDCATNLTVIDQDGAQHDLPGSECGFGYRESCFRKQKTLICEVRLNAPAVPDAQAEIKTTLRRYISHRLAHHPPLWKQPSAGCFFTNPSREPGRGAGALLDQAGFRNRTWGELSLSDLHANFVINRGKGSRADLEQLLNEASAGVRDRFGIQLEREVILVEPDGTQR